MMQHISIYGLYDQRGLFYIGSTSQTPRIRLSNLRNRADELPETFAERLQGKVIAEPIIEGMFTPEQAYGLEVLFIDWFQDRLENRRVRSGGRVGRIEPQYKRYCKVCGREFMSTSPKAKYCSSTCTTRAWRARVNPR